MADKQIPFPLSSQDKTVNQLLNEAVNQTLSRLTVDKNLFNEATTFLLKLTGETYLYTFLTVDGIAEYHKKVFSSPNIRDLVFGIYSSFIARYSSDNHEIDALNEMIARAAAVVNKDTGDNIVPVEISDRLLSYEEILEHLASNPWTTCVALILLYWNHSLALTHVKS